MLLGVAAFVLISVAAVLFNRKRSNAKLRATTVKPPAFATAHGPGGGQMAQHTNPNVMGYSQDQPAPARNYGMQNPMFGGGGNQYNP